MLRSRPNRQQRPSESTDERQGRYGYGGYPSSHGSGGGASVGVGVGLATDDYDSYGKPQPPPGNGRKWLGGGNKSYGRSNSGSKGFNNRDVWDRKTIGSTIKPAKGGGASAGFLLFAIPLIIVAAMGGATLHYRRAHERAQHELMITKRRMKGRRHMGGRFSRGDDEREEPDELPAAEITTAEGGDDLSDLIPTMTSVREEATTWARRTTALQHEVDALVSQIEHLHSGEMTSLESQIAAMTHTLKEEQKKAKDYKEAFVETHKAGAKGIVPGGPGHAAVQRKEIEGMESLDEYEEYVQRREDALWDKVDLLVDKMGSTSRRETLEWFGPGPHRVELEIEYPQFVEAKEANEWPRVRGVLEIEMAPVDLMPVAVNLFLQQVHHQLWNGCSFVINAMHILQAGPHRLSDGGQYEANLADLAGKFEAARLDRMPFQEYHGEFPHARYTLGFAGRPAGPDFYISKVDNSANHGPGGQSHHDLHEEADPCFGKLVGGHDVIKEINKIPVDYDRGGLLLHPVMIMDSRVVTAKQIVIEGGEDKEGTGNEDEGRENKPAMGPGRES